MKFSVTVFAFPLVLYLAVTTACKKEEIRYAPVAEVEGYVALNGKMMTFQDGFISFDTEPLEWEKYGIACRLSHDQFSQEQKSCLTEGKWIDLNYQSLPDGFPVKLSEPKRKPLSPYVRLTFGKWETSHMPTPHLGDIELELNGFAESDYSIPLNEKNFEIIEFQYDPLRIELQTKGKMVDDEEGLTLKWNIQFSGRCYEDEWPLYEKASSSPYFRPHLMEKAEPAESLNDEATPRH